jgi:predicted O-methyltransferase YrrM
MSAEPDYRFTTDWFHWAPEVWAHLRSLMHARQRFLEIGSFEGRSAVWTIENMMEDGGCLYAVDTWEGGEEHKDGGFDVAGSSALFDQNVALVRAKFPDRYVEKLKGESRVVLSRLVGEKLFDFVYIDGSHIACDVLTDACLAWGLLRPGGIMVFDDYTWGASRDVLHRPKIAVDAFVNIFAEELQLLHVGYQLAVRKN